MLTVKGTGSETGRETGERRMGAAFRISKAVILPLSGGVDGKRLEEVGKNKLENVHRMEPWER